MACRERVAELFNSLMMLEMQLAEQLEVSGAFPGAPRPCRREASQRRGVVATGAFSASTAFRCGYEGSSCSTRSSGTLTRPKELLNANPNASRAQEPSRCCAPPTLGGNQGSSGTACSRGISGPCEEPVV